MTYKEFFHKLYNNLINLYIILSLKGGGLYG